jgi:hypothetical protein
MDKIDDDTYTDLARFFDTLQRIEICFTVGLSNMINRFHATFSTELDPIIRAAVGDACPPALLRTAYLSRWSRLVTSPLSRAVGK